MKTEVQRQEQGKGNEVQVGEVTDVMDIIC